MLLAIKDFSLVLFGFCLRVFGLVLLVMQLSCATFESGQRIKDVDKPRNFISWSVLTSLPLGKRSISSNGREYFSNYFRAKGKKFKPATKSKRRYFAQVFILGDQRPYTVEIFVYEEQLIGGAVDAGNYQVLGRNEQFEIVVKKRIQRQLAKSHTDRNMIDDFRVF